MPLIDADNLEMKLEDKVSLNELSRREYDLIMGQIRYEPTVDAEIIPHGYWKHFSMSDDCSVCGYSTGKYESPSTYCPQCGALMDGKAE